MPLHGYSFFYANHQIRAGILPLGHKDEEKNENHLILLISPMANYPCECDGKSKTLELITKYLIQGVSL